MKIMIKLFSPYIVGLFVLIILVWGQASVNLALPDYMSRIVNDVIVSKNMDKVWSTGLEMLGVTLFGGLCATLIGFSAARISSGYVYRLRQAVFSKVESFSLDEFNKFSASSLITRSTNDMQQIQNSLAMILRMAFLAPFIGIGSIIKALDLAPKMSWIVISSIAALIAMIIVMFVVVIPKFSIIQKMVDKLSLLTREMLTGLRVIRAYNNDNLQQDKFDKVNLESTKLNVFVSRIMMLMQPYMSLIMGLASLAVVWLGAYVVRDHELMVGDLMALMQYVMQTIMAFLMISFVFIMVPRAFVSGKRISEILKTDISIKDIDEPIELKQTTGLIEFKNVGFSYKGSKVPVLEDVNFSAKPGEMTAIIGGTGSGKTTLMNLIPRLYDVTSGGILIDGIDIRKIKQSKLREFIGYVPQKASLFSGTIRSNILYGKNKAGEREIDKALLTAQAKEFVDNLPENIEDHVAQAGSNFSGGQKQRLSIARALVRQPKIYLFDDSFSALDYKTDAKLRHALKTELSDVTFIIVAQRISTIMHADKIIVLEEGKVAGIGTHQELLKKSKVYREIAESQLSESELQEGF